MAPPSLLSSPETVLSLTVSPADCAELSGVVMRIAELGIEVLPVTVSADRRRCPSSVTVGFPEHPWAQTSETPMRTGLAPGPR